MNQYQQIRNIVLYKAGRSPWWPSLLHAPGTYDSYDVHSYHYLVFPKGWAIPEGAGEVVDDFDKEADTTGRTDLDFDRSSHTILYISGDNDPNSCESKILLANQSPSGRALIVEVAKPWREKWIELEDELMAHLSWRKRRKATKVESYKQMRSDYRNLRFADATRHQLLQLEDKAWAAYLESDWWFHKCTALVCSVISSTALNHTQHAQMQMSLLEGLLKGHNEEQARYIKETLMPMLRDMQPDEIGETLEPEFTPTQKKEEKDSPWFILGCFGIVLFVLALSIAIPCLIIVWLDISWWWLPVIFIGQIIDLIVAVALLGK